jgi:hypothetical protein
VMPPSHARDQAEGKKSTKRIKKKSPFSPLGN